MTTPRDVVNGIRNAAQLPRTRTALPWLDRLQHVVSDLYAIGGRGDGAGGGGAIEIARAANIPRMPTAIWQP